MVIPQMINAFTSIEKHCILKRYIKPLTFNLAYFFILLVFYWGYACCENRKVPELYSYLRL